MGTVSIIVPVYNVSEYLDRCLKSLTGQTYRDVEIIVVDDGSTDDSGMKCDRWATGDNRIKVIHQSNRGLSGARNTGLDVSKGEYILFVDSDDYVDSEYVSKLYNNVMCNRADIAICNYLFVNEAGTEINNDNYSQYTSNTVFDGTDALLLFENKSYRTFFDVVWNKIFKRELFDGVRFPEGVSVVEDITVMPILYHKAGRVSVISDRLYYYVYRNESLSHAKRTEQEDLDIRIPMMEQRLTLYREWGIKEISLLHITHMYSMYRKRNGNHAERMKCLQKEFRRVYNKGNYIKRISLSRRVKFALAAFSLKLYDRIADSR
ncbi:MAG: glycosyltransferase [Lachnospiraceae bacterium]|nr:glycosyltransferase [Lachnospiraceae bacterium]